MLKEMGKLRAMVAGLMTKFQQSDDEEADEGDQADSDMDMDDMVFI